MKRLFSIVLCLLALGLLNSGALQSADIQAIRNEAGLIDIEPINFYFHYGSYFSRLDLQSSQAHIWYSFHAADKRSEDKPLFIFFNGGPGSATSSGLMSMYTGRYTLDNRIDSGGGDRYIPNHVSWTSMGNLLYIDARQAGFSYNEIIFANDYDARFREFNSQNFNCFFDAADFIRVVLRFLEEHPQLRDNPVIIVGESYGGTRTLTMLHILLNYADYGNGREMFQDPALSQEIQAHYDRVFPQYAGQVVPPEVIVEQFGHQILIQPTCSFGYHQEITEEMFNTPGSVIYQIGEEVGIPYDPDAYEDPYYFVRDVAGRDLYMYAKPRDWLGRFFGNAATLLHYTWHLNLVTGVDVTEISELYASERSNAYRIFDTNYEFSLMPETNVDPVTKYHFLVSARLGAESVRQEPGNLPAVFGILQPWDRYFMRSNYHANWAFHVLNVAKIRGYDAHYYDNRFGRMFLKNVAHVETFITNAPHDLVVYTPALPQSLKRHEDIVESVQHVRRSTDGEERPGKIIVEYLPSAFPDIQGLDRKVIRFPIYSESAHAVSLTQPEDFYADVSSWLKEKGIDID
jgi:pimeloyl-ACP methyl ester carboxylesterase